MIRRGVPGDVTLKLGGATFIEANVDRLALETLLIKPDDEGELAPVFAPKPQLVVPEADKGAASETEDGKPRSMYM